MSRRPLTRKQLGAWYTPTALVDHVLDEVLEPHIASLPSGSTVSVLDPACGDGRFLLAAGERLFRAGLRPELTGVDLDDGAVRACRDALGGLPGARSRVMRADALAHPWGDRRFDVVLGNPPFLSPLVAANGVRMTDRAGGPYADAAAEFLALALRLVHPDRGRIGLVMPLSIVASRDAAPVRAAVERVAPLEWFWFAPRPVFDAEVRTCALGLVAGGALDAVASVRRSHGKRFVAEEPITPPSAPHDPGESWAWLLADQLGVPDLPAPLELAGELGELAVCSADFRDEYYGLVGAVEEDAGTGGTPLVTSGLIDAGVCHWGERPTRLHKQRFERPVVRLERLQGPMVAWAAQRMVPKVMVANQTKTLEPLADPTGRWLPSVPVVSVTPRDPADVWRIAAALTGPVPSIWLASRASGSGMSAHAVRVAAPMLARLPMPSGSLAPAVALLRAGDVTGSARSATSAYGVRPGDIDRLMEWWLSASTGRPATARPRPR